MAAEADPSLSDLQLDLMRVLWRLGEASTAEVAEALAPERRLAHTTVATLLGRLEKRGLISARREGRQWVYRAEIEEGSVRRSMVSSLLGSLFGGDAKALVAHLVREEEIAADDLDELNRLIDRRTDPS